MTRYYPYFSSIDDLVVTAPDSLACLIGPAPISLENMMSFKTQTKTDDSFRCVIVCETSVRFNYTPQPIFTIEILIQCT